ncbi:MAG: hypothetical protein WC343_12220 [Bacilli bacterium]|jgi:hypothetical protein
MTKTETTLENELIQKMADSELAVLINSMNELRKSIQTEPTAAKIATMEKLKEAIAKHQAAKKEEKPEIEPCFNNRNEVLKHLQALGYKVSKTKIYQDEKKGILRMNTDGKIPHSAVRAYVDDPRSRLGIGVYESDEKVKDITLKIKEKEFEKLCEQVSMARFQRERAEGLHIKISEYEAEIASRAAVFEAMLRQSNEAVADRIIIATGIKQAHRQLLIDLLNEALMDALAAYVAQDEIIGEVMEG